MLREISIAGDVDVYILLSDSIKSILSIILGDAAPSNTTILHKPVGSVIADNVSRYSLYDKSAGLPTEVSNLFEPTIRELSSACRAQWQTNLIEI